MGRWVTWDELEGRLRGIVRRAKPRRIDDTGASQTADVSVLNGEHRAGVEILQPYGQASNPPEGSVLVVFAVGGDQGDLVAFPAGAPGARMGKLRPGESMIYGGQGQRVLCRADGAVEVIAATKVYLSGKTTEIESAEAVSVKAPKVRIGGEPWLMGDVHVAGSMTVGGTTTQAPPPGGDPAAPAR
mgnify:CR=1 FL=1